MKHPTRVVAPVVVLSLYVATFFACGPDQPSVTEVPRAPLFSENWLDDPEPMFQPGSGTLIWQDDFEGYSSDEEMIANYITIDNHQQYFQLAAGAGLNASKAVRYHWLAQGAGACQDDSRLLERVIPSLPAEIYVRYSIRYSPGFAFDWNLHTPCDGNAKKIFFLYSPNETSSRFDFISENHWLGMGSDFDHPLLAQNVGPEMTTDNWGDGNWHRVTMHVIQSSTPNAADGLIEAWIDGVKRWHHPNWTSRSEGGWGGFMIGANINQGAPQVQDEWVDSIMVWQP